MSHKPRIAVRLATVLLAALALVAAGCGHESASTRQAVVVVQGVDPTSMDPTNQQEVTTMNVLRHFYDSLVMRDARDPRKLLPDLALSWRRVNPTTTEFKLRKGVTFAGGEPFDARAVKYTFDLMLGKLPGSQPRLLSFEFRTVAGAQVVDRHTVRVITKQPDALLLDRMALLMIVPRGADPDKLSSEPDGTGPYRMVAWRRNDRVVMKANPDYFRGAPKIPDVEFRTLPDASARLAALQAGDADVITNVPPDNIAEVDGSDNATASVVPSNRIVMLVLNTREAPELKDPRVRRALNMAVNVDSIIKNVMGGNATRVATMVPPYFAGHDPSIRPYRYDPAAAKRLLAQAGYGHGFPLPILVPQGRYENASEISQAIVSDLDKVGVKARLQTVDYGVFAKDLATRHIPAAFFGAWGELLANPIDQMQVTVFSGSPASWYSDRSVDAGIMRASATVDEAEQDQLISRLQRKLLDDPPYVFLFAYKDAYGVANRLNWSPRTDEQISMYDASVNG